MNVQTIETPFGGALGAPLAGGQPPLAPPFLGIAQAPPGDAIARFTQPNTVQSGPLTNPFGSMLGQIMQMLQSLLGALGIGGFGGGFGGFPNAGGIAEGNEQFYGNANGGSQGDPHLSFNGNTWSNMTSQPDLLESNSIPGGFQLSTQVTAPNAQGVTYNQSATIALNGGATTISMNNAGQPSITEYGQQLSVAPGQSLALGNGTSVTWNANGSLSVLAQNGYGGQISTTLTPAGEGVNVAVSAQNVDLGGSLANGGNIIPFGAPSNAPLGTVPSVPNAFNLPAFGPPLPATQTPFPWETRDPLQVQP